MTLAILRKTARRLLSLIGYYEMSNIQFRRSQRENLRLFQEHFGVGNVIENIVNRSSASAHKLSAEHAQFVYASNELYDLKPRNILDIGSHLSWLYGVGSYYDIETLDVRDKETLLRAERFFKSPVENLPFEDNSKECVTSICSLEHFGLGAYGDPVSVDGDSMALRQIARVLKFGGHYIFTTTMNREHSYVEFNARRVYSYGKLRELAVEFGFKVFNEGFYSLKSQEYVELQDVVQKKAINNFDLYLGHWIKS